MRNRLTACGLALVVAVCCGCTDRQPATGEPERSAIESVEPTASLRATHGDNFVSGSVDSTAAATDGVALTVTLREPLGPGELAGSRPYADIALLHGLYPKRQWYRVIYRVGEDESMWAWGSDRSHQLQYWGRRRMLHPSSYVNGVNAAKLGAIAAGDAAPLKLQPAR
jgi:hypothetical protein